MAFTQFITQFSEWFALDSAGPPALRAAKVGRLLRKRAAKLGRKAAQFSNAEPERAENEIGLARALLQVMRPERDPEAR
jgi:hypothetical protein